MNILLAEATRERDLISLVLTASFPAAEAEGFEVINREL
jgi:hypothetical protein